MKYLGGKSRICNQIISVMSAEREEGMAWVEPFMGSGKVISKVTGQRIGADVNHEMIALFKAIRGGWIPPTEVTRDFYYEVKNNQDKYPDHLKAFISIGCSFGGHRWSSYAATRPPRPKNKLGDNYAKQAHNALMKLKPLLENIELVSCSFESLKIPPNSLIYCDPPYLNTAGYGFSFDHNKFYDWCRDRVKDGHRLFVSEYSMPPDFEEIWSKKVIRTCTSLNNTYKIERLFRLHKKPKFTLKMY